MGKLRFWCAEAHCFFFQGEDGIRDVGVTGVQTCALPISLARDVDGDVVGERLSDQLPVGADAEIGRGSCRGRGEISVGAVFLKKKKNTKHKKTEQPVSYSHAPPTRSTVTERR